MLNSTLTDQKLYTFRAEVLEYPEDSWRDIQIHSNQTSDELGAAVLAAFEAKGGNQWNLETSDAYFEYNLDSETAEWQRQRGAVVIGTPDDKSIGDLDFKVDNSLCCNTTTVPPGRSFSPSRSWSLFPVQNKAHIRAFRLGVGRAW